MLNLTFVAFWRWSLLPGLLLLFLFSVQINGFMSFQPIKASSSIAFTALKSANRSILRKKLKTQKRIPKSEEDVFSNGRWKQAEIIERKTLVALERLRDQTQGKKIRPVSFPSVRECNSALASFGDGGDFLRALGLFLKMRKSVSLAQGSGDLIFSWKVPAPTLVTYSTLMSRAVQVGKERLALRLWYLMKTQAEFFSSKTKAPITTVILPDIKAANILMNVHAKLCDVEEAKYIFSQMIHGNGTDVPRLEPNIVTYNTLLDACQKAGDLESALEAKRQLDESRNHPDARTYTSLIGSVGRNATATSGANDPSMAFSFLSEMIYLGIRPNGMTYAALIDACGRCGRTDLALKGLRTMLRQKQKERRTITERVGKRELILFNEVGAWTAAIDALGKVGSLETAMRLFYKMPKVGVLPNTITCGCLTDNLLRHGKTIDALEILMYMKEQNIVPSEVMYTSLMTSAGRMAELENKQKWNEPEIKSKSRGDCDAKAIDVYSALMKTLTEERDVIDKKNTQLLKVFLVFQEMRAAGADPDLACYNALLQACARANDIHRALDVLKKMKEDGVNPNETSWREALKAAANAHNSGFAEEIWLKYQGNHHAGESWQPSIDCFSALLAAYIREARTKQGNAVKQLELYKHAVTMYRDAMTNSEKRKIDREKLLQSERALGLVLEALVGLDSIEQNEKKTYVIKRVAVFITKLDIWNKRRKLNPLAQKSFSVAKKWRRELEGAR
mmetsp:Transcript_11180/g.16412  ORF Transcript_11180/g.16412 Transcript_11180/m.16412 type:complete len:734 (+) Transcript_11180:191-2392(+)